MSCAGVNALLLPPEADRELLALCAGPLALSDKDGRRGGADDGSRSVERDRAGPEGTVLGREDVPMLAPESGPLEDVDADVTALSVSALRRSAEAAEASAAAMRLRS